MANACDVQIQAKAGVNALMVNKVKLISQTLASFPESQEKIEN